MPHQDIQSGLMNALTAQFAHHGLIDFGISGPDVVVVHGKAPLLSMIATVLYLVSQGLTMGRINEYSLPCVPKDGTIHVRNCRMEV